MTYGRAYPNEAAFGGVRVFRLWTERIAPGARAAREHAPMNVEATRDELERLRQRVRELEDERRRRRRGEEDLRRREEAYEFLYEQSLSAIVMLDADGRIIDVNRSFAESLGFDKEEVPGRAMEDFIAPEWRDEARALLDSAFAGEPSPAFEIDLVGRDGRRTLWFASGYVPVEIGGQAGILISGTDITDRKRSERRLKESEAKYAALVEQSLDAVMIIQHGRYTFCNATAVELTGYSTDELLAMDRYDELFPADERERVRRNHEARIRGESAPTRYESKLLCRDGAIRDVELSGRIIEINGEPANLGTIRDITQRKRIEEALRRSERRLRMLLDASPDLLYRRCLDADEFEYLSPACERVLGFTRQELSAMSWEEAMDRIHPDDRRKRGPNLDEIARRSLEPVEPYHHEYRWRRGDGEYVWLRDHRMVVRDAGGEPIAIVGAVTDVTEHHRLEDALRASRERFRRTFEQAGVGLAQTAPDGRFIHVNEMFCRTLGYTADELLARRVQDVTHPDDLPSTLDARREAAEGGEGACSLEKRYLRKDGEVVRASVSVSIVQGLLDDGEDGYVVTMTDVTRRDRAIEALKDQSAFQQSLLDALPLPVFYKNTEGVYLGCNRAFAEFLGVGRDRIVGRSVFDVAPTIHAEQYRTMDERLLAEPGTQSYESTVSTADGDRRVIFHKATFVNRDGTIGGLIGAVQDITRTHRLAAELKEARAELAAQADRRTEAVNELTDTLQSEIADRRRAEAALKDSGARLRTVIESLPFDFWMIGRDGRYVMQNAVSRRCYGDMVGRTPEDVAGDEEVLARWLDNNRRAFAGETVTGEIDIPVEGELRHFYNVVSPVVQEGRVTAIMGVNVDLTERRRAESAVHDTKEYLETLIAASLDGILVVDAEGRFEFSNDAFCRIVGWPRENLVGTHFLDAVPPDSQEFVLARWEEVRRGQGTSYEMDVVGKDGKRRSVLISHRHMNIGGERKYCAVVKDNTERKRSREEVQRAYAELDELVSRRTAELTEANRRLTAEIAERGRAEQAVRASEARLEAILSSLRDSAVSVVARDGTVLNTWAAPEARRRLGLDEFARPGRRIAENLPPAEARRVMRAVRTCFGTGESHRHEFRWSTDAGEFWLDVAYSPVLDGDGDAREVVIFGYDVTRSKRAEQMLRAAHRQLMSAREAERRRLAGELHDSVGQSLVAMQLDIQRAAAAAGDDADDLRRIADRCGETLRDVRSICHGLYPPTLEVLGLVPSLSELLKRCGGAIETATHFTPAFRKETLSPDAAIALFRVAQEAVANAIQHSSAGKVTLEGRRRRGRVILRVHDDGSGFDPDRSAGKGLGLHTMRERCSAVGGELAITSDETGTCVEASLPVRAED